jgi:hypothetical protein
MRSNTLLVLLTALSSAVCWWPLFVQPNLELPFWSSLACATLCTGLSTALAATCWPLLLLISGLGTFGGLCLGIMIWPPSDPIGAAIIPYYVAANTLAVILVALSAGFIMRRRSISNEISRRTVLAAIFACAAFGPVTLALTPTVVRHRIDGDDRLAGDRFAALKNAVERTAEAEGSSQICDGTALRRRYAGPPFSDTDWRRITGNFVKQDGYFFMVYCREKGGYTIDARPARERGDGTRRFCTDESGRVGCRVEWDGSRYKCLPCPK